MPEDKCRIVFAQLVNVVDYLDSLGYVHRDLKDENIVVDEKYKIKLIDFGSCAKIPMKGDKANYFDRFNGNFIIIIQLTFSLGTLHFASPEILMGQHYRGPEAEVWSMGVILYTMLYGMNPFQKPDDIVKGKVKYPTQGIHVDLMIKMFEHDAEKRITLEEIKKHPYVAAYLA
jgi:serine/threonine protein kinase